MGTQITILLSIVILLFSVCLILLIRALYEPHKLTISHEELDANSYENPDINICFISDLHAEMCFINVQEVIREISMENNTRPVDMVIFGGDICNSPKKFDKGVKYLQKISEFCKEHDIIFAGVTGNHDVELNSSIIDSCGFINLSNKPLLFEKNGKKYHITGVKDSGRHNRKWGTISASKDNTPTILISHNPDILLHTDSIKDIDYCISGHIHGGQIRTPFKIEFTILRKDEFPKLGIFYGKHQYKNCTLYIGRGIGCILMPFRLGALPEISFLTIKKR